MDGVTAYDDDFYAWAHEQAAVLRRLAETRRDLPNELDVENLVEEIEGVARTELRSAESLLSLVLVHLLKIASAPQSRAVAHWSAEALGFQAQLERAVTPTIKRKMNFSKLWKVVRRQAEAQLELEGDALIPGLPAELPLDVDELSGEAFDLDRVLAKLVASAGEPR